MFCKPDHISIGIMDLRQDDMIVISGFTTRYYLRTLLFQFFGHLLTTLHRKTDAGMRLFLLFYFHQREIKPNFKSQFRPSLV